jgi:regulator of ribonuclease activity B
MTESSHAIRDAEVRRVLAEHGDDGQIPRHTLFYFYGGRIDELHNAAVGAGYKVSPTAAQDGLVLETTISVDAESFEAQSQRMQAWADEFGSAYDGWECAVVEQ